MRVVEHSMQIKRCSIRFLVGSLTITRMDEGGGGGSLKIQRV